MRIFILLIALSLLVVVSPAGAAGPTVTSMRDSVKIACPPLPPPGVTSVIVKRFGARDGKLIFTRATTGVGVSDVTRERDGFHFLLKDNTNSVLGRLPGKFQVICARGHSKTSAFDGTIPNR